MTEKNGMRPLTIRLGDRRTTVRFNMDKETHRKAWDRLCKMRDQYPANSDSEQVKHAIKMSTRKRGETWREVLQTLKTEWTKTEESLSEACVIRECLRRAGQQVEA